MENVTNITGIEKNTKDLLEPLQIISMLSFGMNKFNHIVCIIDSDGTLLYANDYTMKRYGFDHAVLEKTSIFELIPYLGNNRFKKYVDRTNGDEPLLIDLEIKEKDGSFCPFSISILGIEYGGRKVLFAFGIDISRNIEAQIELARRSNMMANMKNRLESISENATDGLILFEENNYKITWANSKAKEIGNQLNPELVDQICYKQLYGRDTPCRNCPVDYVFKSKKKTTVDLQASGNRYYSINISPVLKNGKFSGVLQTIRDVTSFKWSEKTLNDINEKISMAINASRLVLWNFYKGQNIILIEDPTQSIFTNREYSIGYSDWIELVHPDDKEIFDKSINKHLYDGMRPFELTFRIRDKFNDYIWVELSAKATVDAETGKYKEQILGFLRNINEEKKYAIELQEAKDRAEESERMKSAFLANISHEIRTPLNAIVGFTGVVTNQSEEISDEQRKKYYGLIEKNASILLSLIGDILDLSKIEQNDFTFSNEVVQFNSMLRDIKVVFSQHIVEKGKGDLFLKLETPLEDEKAFIEADKARFTQVINNLLTNAVKFTARGGITFGYHEPQDGRIDFYVTDTGKGISKENQSHIFEAFKQETSKTSPKYGGTGLGLAIAKRIVEIMNGEILLNSVINEGTTFIIRLPYQEGIQKISNSNDILLAGIDSFDFEGKTLFVIDGNDHNHLLISQLLVDTNCIIQDSYSGKRALRTIKGIGEFDVILINSELEDCNVIELVTSIREIKPNIPIILQSSQMSNEQSSQYYEAGIDDILTLPIKKEMLLNKLYVAFSC